MIRWLGVGPLSICRLDEELVSRVREERDLTRLILAAAVWMWIGAALYGYVFGLWRAPMQAAFAAIKLPVLLTMLVVSTAAATGVFAKLVGTRLTMVQSLTCSVLSMAMLSIIAASIAPISLLFNFAFENYGERLVGVRVPEAQQALRDAELLLALHVAVIGAAGLLALQKLRGLLEQLVGQRRRAAQFFWMWLAIQALAGTQLSWILRPYLGKPGLPVQFFRSDAFRGSFLEEVGRWIGL